jgi:hypothetical protein
MVAPRWTGVQDLSCSMILWQDLLCKTLVLPLMPAGGALVACLTGLVSLTSTRIYDLHYSTGSFRLTGYSYMVAPLVPEV